MKLKLKTRIVGGLLCIFLLAATLGAVSLVTTGQVQSMTQQLYVLTALDASVNEVLEDLHIWRYELVSSIVFDTLFTNSLHASHSAYGVWRNSPNATWIYDEEISRLIALLDASNEQMHTATLELIAAQYEGVINAALLSIDLEQRVLPLVAESITNIQALSSRYNYLVYFQQEEVRNFQNTVSLVIGLICVFAALLFVVLSFFITNAIIKPVKQIADAASEVASGKLSVNLAYDIDDEIGMLTGEVRNLVTVIRDMVLDLSKVKQEFNVVGNMSYRLDADKYQNSFGDMIVSVNDILSENSSNVTGICKTLDSISQGDFDIEIADMPGDFAMQSNAMRSVISNLKSISAEVGTMIEAAAVKGNLNFSIDAGKYTGDCVKLCLGLTI